MGKMSKIAKIELGDTVMDIYSGLKGSALAKTEFLNGCIQIDVQPPVDKDNKLPEGVGVDIQQLKLIKKADKNKPKPKPKPKVDPPGGPYTRRTR